MSNKYDYQFGESEKIIDEANLKADLIEMLENLWNNYRPDVKKEFKADYETLIKKAKDT